MRNEGFIFENLKVYQRSLDLAVNLIRISKEFPREFMRIQNQLIGAAISVPLNLAEGSGRFSQKDKNNFYKIARSSAFELIPILDIIYKLALISKEKLLNLRTELSEVSKIISSLIK